MRCKYYSNHNVTRGHHKGTLQGDITRGHHKGTLQGDITRGHYKGTLQGDILTFDVLIWKPQFS